MAKPRILLSLALLSTVLLCSATAFADLVLLLPAKGQVPGSLLGSVIDRETRYAIIELGHKLVDKDETDAAIRRAPSPDNSDAYGALARVTPAAGVIAPAVNPLERGYHLELTAFRAKDARTEAVARDIDTERVHDQTVEMLRVLMRPEGVGTGALPWETGGVRAAPRSSTPAGSSSQSPGPGNPPATPPEPFAHRWIFAGAGVGGSAAVRRPGCATGSTGALAGDLRAGISPIDPVEIAANFSINMTGPKALMFDASARYMWMAAPAIRLSVGPEAGVGAFHAGGGSQATSFMARGSLITAARVSELVSLEASLGDLRVIPASSGTLVLAGASLHGVLRF